MFLRRTAGRSACGGGGRMRFFFSFSRFFFYGVNLNFGFMYWWMECFIWRGDFILY